MTVDQKRILIVEDDEGIARLLTDYLRIDGFNVRWARTAHEALVESQSFLPDLVLLDITLAAGLVTLSATATTSDFDNDTATATVSADLGGNIAFDDDVPSVSAATVADGGIVLTTQDAQTIGAVVGFEVAVGLELMISCEFALAASEA